MSKFVNYLKDTRAELEHVSWPSQRQTIIYTALVIGISAFVAVFVGLFDQIFNHIVDWFIK